MRRSILLYVIVFTLLAIVSFFFNNAYRQLTTYAELTNRHNEVYINFQNLSRLINNAAILTPELIHLNNSPGTGKFFPVDSLDIIRQIALLKSLVRDSVNIALAAELDILIKPEISWLLNSNVPDSVIHNKSSAHIAAFKKIDSLISKGIKRTNFLIIYRKALLDEEFDKVRVWMITFTIASFLLIVYITVSLFEQQSKRKVKEKELQTVLNRMSDGVISLDSQWRYTYLNDAALASHNLGNKEIIGKSISDIHPQITETVFWEKYQEARQTNEPAEFENYYPASQQWYSVKAYPSADGLTIFYKNITSTKISEEKLSQTLQELKDYKFALDESSIVAITDQKGRIRYVNDNFCKISKYSREELVGQDHRIINSGYHSKEFIRNIWVTIASGTIWKGEIRNRAKDGTIYWVDTTIVPFLNDAGKPYQYVAIRADVTERKLAEEKLVKSERIYKTIASGIPGSVICLLDRDYRYLLIEGDMIRKLGYSKNQLLGNKAADILSPDIFAGIEEDFKKAFLGETITREVNRSGYDLISKYIPLKDENNIVFAIMTVAIDITALKKAQRNIIMLNRELEDKIVKRTEQLRKSNEELEAFSYSVSHDLRAPLRGIIGFSAILEEDYGQKLDEEGKRIISVVKGSALKMGNLIDDLLAFSRLGKQSIQKSTINNQTLVTEIIDELSNADKEPKTIHWNIYDLPPVQADLNTIRQVWINLISNAIKYSSGHNDASIEIGSYAGNKEIVFYVRDNGVGFNDAYKHKLFKVFQRLHAADEFEGTGVGLAIVEKIVSRHGGNVWAEGKENEGACFYFSLPDL